MGRSDASSHLTMTEEMFSLDEIDMFVFAELVEDGGDEPKSVGGVGAHMAHDEIDADGGGGILAVAVAPAVVVCRHTDHLIRHLGFTCQLGFRQGRHVDDAGAPGPIQVAFGARAELGPFCSIANVA